MKKTGFLGAFWVFLFIGSLFADNALELQVLEISGDLRCPICQGLSVRESETVIAQNIKNEIRTQLQAGKSRQEILDYFQSRYGEWILRAPNKKGINLLVWILPFAGFFVSAFLIYLKLRSWHARSFKNKQVGTLSKDEENKFNKLFQ